jgi:DNA-binding PadR family transcriptional regulator
MASADPAIYVGPDLWRQPINIRTMGKGLPTIGYALLGVLAREPLSGYDISRRMRASVGAFWQAQRSQIYPELARLETAGLVAHHRVEQLDRPDKKVYQITDQGRAALQRWVTEPAGVPASRNEFVLKVYSLWLAEPRQALAFVRTREAQHRERLERLESTALALERELGGDALRPDTPGFGSYATVLAGVHAERAQADWCAWLAERLEGAGHPSGAAPAAPLAR